MVNKFVAVLFFLASLALVFLSYGPLSNLWADYQDSGVGTYIVVGGVELALAVAAAAAAVVLLRAR